VLRAGRQFGKVFVGLQPVFGYEGDPMRLLFEKGFAPTHAFTTFYRWLREDFGADASCTSGCTARWSSCRASRPGMGRARCWPDRLIGNLPNIYLYAANNPSEATLAKRRSNAITVTHLTPPLAQAGALQGAADLKDSLTRWRGLPRRAGAGRSGALIAEQAGGGPGGRPETRCG
jgi:magnesium chelatase subunit H